MRHGAPRVTLLYCRHAVDAAFLYAPYAAAPAITPLRFKGTYYLPPRADAARHAAIAARHALLMPLLLMPPAYAAGDTP